MENVIIELKNEQNVIDFVSNVDYGSTYFICKNKDILSFVDSSLKILNESIGSLSLRYEPERLTDMLEFYNCTVDIGLFKVISSLKKEMIPELSEDSFFMLKYMNDAFNNKRQVRLYLDESLYSYAKKISKKDLLFGHDQESAFFIGAKKELRVYDQIKESFYRGEDFVKFDLNLVSVSTIRCYTSTLSKMSGNKFRCNISEGSVIVYFKPMSELHDSENKIRSILKMFKNNDQKFNFLMSMAAEFKDNTPKIDDQYSDDEF